MPEERPKGSMSRELKTLGLGSLIFFVPTLLTRGLSFILTPLYTRYLTPDDYGIVGLGTTLYGFVALLLGASAWSAASRLYHQMPDERAKARLGGTVLGFLLVVPPALALVIEAIGSAGWFSPFRSVPYAPYLRLVVWAGVLSLFQSLAANMLMIREQHKRGASLNSVLVVVTAFFTVLMVVVLRKGAYGQLLALVLANAVVGAWSIVIAWRFSPPVFDRAILKEVLVFSLPLIPHETSKWILAASDRLILERYVSAADLGRYSLGYSFGSAVGIFLGAVSIALFPIVNRKLAEKDPHNEVPVLGSVVVVACTFASLLAATMFPPFLALAVPHAYDGAGAVVPWIALGFFFQTLYLIWSQGTFFSRKTGAVALVTFAGAAVNIGLNLVFVPRFGYLVAAVTTAVGYAVMAGLHGLLSRKLHPIPWEHGRTVRIALAALITYAAAVSIRGLTPMTELLVRGAISAVGYVGLLVVLGAARPSEIARVRSLLKRR